MSPEKANWLSLLPAGLLLAWLWFAAINHLRIEWTLNAQYNYGWAVPLLCLYLVWNRCKIFAVSATIPPAGRNRETGRTLYFVALAVLAVSYAPVRLIGEANPEWRLVSWALALVVVGVTLAFVGLVAGKRGLGFLAFPVIYFLVAVPWPTVLEQAIIPGLSQGNASLSTELLGFLGVPGLARGNVIEIGTGLVGVDEACSGIRSLQATLMLSLFFGELYQLGLGKRVVLCAVGLVLALLFNLLRTTLLVMIASRQGLAAMNQWHHPAGVLIILGAFIGLWLAALWLKRDKSKIQPRPIGTGPAWQSLVARMIERVQAAGVNRFLVVTGVWILLAESGVQAWYLGHERWLPPPQPWVAEFPREYPDFKIQTVPDRTRQLLRNDEARSATWRDLDGTHWQGIFLRWNPGKTATYLARGHTPDVCLTAAGADLKSQSDVKFLCVQGLALPVRFYRLAQDGQVTDVLYCLWEDRMERQEFQTQFPTCGMRLAAVMAGHRLQGQRSLELAVRGFRDAADAEAALTRAFLRMIKLSGPPAVAPMDVLPR